MNILTLYKVGESPTEFAGYVEPFYGGDNIHHVTIQFDDAEHIDESLIKQDIHEAYVSAFLICFGED